MEPGPLGIIGRSGIEFDRGGGKDAIYGSGPLSADCSATSRADDGCDGGARRAEDSLVIPSALARDAEELKIPRSRSDGRGNREDGPGRFTLKGRMEQNLLVIPDAADDEDELSDVGLSISRSGEPQASS